jgi:hypothetical protein
MKPSDAFGHGKNTTYVLRVLDLTDAISTEMALLMQ